VHPTNINKVRTVIFYQSTMFLLVIDFTYLEGRNGDIVVDFQSIRVSSHVFKRPYGCDEIPIFKARINEAIDHGCNWNDSHVLYSELDTVVNREASSGVAIYCVRPQKTQYISGNIVRTVIDITQLGCPPLTDIILPAISCTFACHNKFKYICALRSAYSLA